MKSSHKKLLTKIPGEAIKEAIRKLPDPEKLTQDDLENELKFDYQGLIAYLTSEKGQYSETGPTRHKGISPELHAKRIEAMKEIIAAAQTLKLASGQIDTAGFQKFLGSMIERYFKGDLAGSQSEFKSRGKDTSTLRGDFDDFIYKPDSRKHPEKYKWRAIAHKVPIVGVDHEFARFIAAADRITCRLAAVNAALAAQLLADLDKIIARAKRNGIVLPIQIVQTQAAVISPPVLQAVSSPSPAGQAISPVLQAAAPLAAAVSVTSPVPQAVQSQSPPALPSAPPPALPVSHAAAQVSAPPQAAVSGRPLPPPSAPGHSVVRHSFLNKPSDESKDKDIKKDQQPAAQAGTPSQGKGSS